MSKKVIDCDLLVDGVSDEPMVDARIIVEGESIAAVGPQEDLSVPAGGDVTHEAGHAVTPGFIDAHVHLDGTRTFSPYETISNEVPYKTALAAADLRRLVEAGFTSVRDLGSVAGLGLRDAVNAGELLGPRIRTSGSIFSQSAGHADIPSLPHEWLEHERLRSVLADGVAECRKKVRQELRRGIDVVKIMTTGGMASENTSPDFVYFTEEEIAVFTEEAHRLGVPVASHAQGAPGITAAIRNGVDTIEHAIGIDEEGVELARERGTIIVSTVSAIYRLATEGADFDLPDHHVRKGKEYTERHVDSIRYAVEEGLPVAFGTDCNGSHLHPHGDNAIEFEVLVEEVGMSELDAIKAGTSLAARAIGNDSVGSVEPGKFADFVLFDENPLEDISVTRSGERSVYLGGERVVD